MDFLDVNIIIHWLNNTIELLPRVCVAMIAAYVAMRITALRRALNGTHKRWQYRVITVFFFGLLAIIGTHSGLRVDIHQGGAIINWTTSGVSFSLQPSHAIIGFRDLMVLTAGLFGGPWGGFCAGLLAGADRFFMGGFAGTVSAIATVLQGLGAGLSRQFWPQWTTTAKGILIISLLGTLLQKLLLFTFVQPHADAIALVRETVIPVLLVNSLGCLLFMVVMKDLERDRLKIEAQRAELRALHAQVEPHFLNNTLNAIHTLIGINPNTAADYVVKLARFLDNTRKNAGANSITLGQELSQLRQYMAFQNLRFPDKFHFHDEIPVCLSDFRIPPRSLQTLVENALIHGMRGLKKTMAITLTGEDNGQAMRLSIIDNGCGIAPGRLQELCKSPVQSEQGSGNALHQMNQSLNLAFNGRAKLDIQSQLGKGTKVILTLPKRSEPW
ncbi:MAG: histidine kinase [Methyloglobulus sp.]|nr:histidine kinase [Methyloglobulus sp.]